MSKMQAIPQEKFFSYIATIAQAHEIEALATLPDAVDYSVNGFIVAVMAFHSDSGPWPRIEYMGDIKALDDLVAGCFAIS